MDEVDALRKRLRYDNESPCFRLTYFQSETSLHLHITTLRAHSLGVQTRCGTISALPFMSPSPATSGSNLRSLMITVRPPLRQLRCTTALTADTVVSAFGKHETRVQVHTREIVQQRNVTLARDASAKRSTEYRAIRTLCTTCSWEILRQRRPLLQPQHQRWCHTLGDLLRLGRDNSHKNTFAVLNVVQIL